jgi:hypothetical protein
VYYCKLHVHPKYTVFVRVVREVVSLFVARWLPSPMLPVLVAVSRDSPQIPHWIPRSSDLYFANCRTISDLKSVASRPDDSLDYSGHQGGMPLR